VSTYLPTHHDADGPPCDLPCKERDESWYQVMDLFDDDPTGDGLHTWPTRPQHGAESDVTRLAHSPVLHPTGEVLGSRYEVGAEIGSGASAITYRGRDLRLGRMVAIKILRRDHAQDAAYVRRFEREARAAASVSHGNVVDTYDVGQHDGLLYIVMQFIDGENLKQLITREAPLAPARAIGLTQQILAGLGAVHRAGIIHRDIKPQNVLLDRDGVVHVADFGIAHLSVEAGLTTTGITAGTASYMAPEQAQGARLVRATDLYAVGVVLYEMLTGRAPFDAPTAVALMVAHIQTVPIRPSQRAPSHSISRALDSVVMRVLAKHPDDRFPDTTSMARALVAAIEQPDRAVPAGPAGVASPSLSGRPSMQRSQIGGPVNRPDRRSRRAVAVITVALLALLALGAVLVMGRLLEAGTSGQATVPAQVALLTSNERTATATPTATREPTVTVAGPRRSTVRDPQEPVLATRAVVFSTDTPAPTPTLRAIPMPSPTEPLLPTETLPPTEPPVSTDTPEPRDQLSAPNDTSVLTVIPADAIIPVASAEMSDEGASRTSDPPTIDGQGRSQQVIGSDRETPSAVPGGPTGTNATRTLELGFAASDWNGAYYQATGNLQPWSALYAQSTGYGDGTLQFEVAGEPAAESFTLTLEGMTSENWTDLPIAVRINGQEVYTGTSPFATWNGTDGQQPWTDVRLDLPASALQQGENTITVVNLVDQGGFSVPPYVLLAGGTLTIQVRNPA
jgi:tRNA A-37 threonylcarbamoyl transferase component Bud32